MFKLIEYSNEFENIWDNFIYASNQGTFLHTRRYLNYHNDRFIDKSLLIKLNNKIIAVFPSAISNFNEKIIIFWVWLISNENISFFLLLFFRFFLNKLFDEELNNLSIFFISDLLLEKKISVPERLFNFADFIYFSLIIIFLFNFLSKRVFVYFIKFQ